MELIPKSNEEFGEIDYFKAKVKAGVCDRNITVIFGDDLVHIDEKISKGKNEIFKDSFVLDRDLLEAINNVIKTYNL